MYTVIKFKEDGTVLTVPTSWIDPKTNICKWPPGLPSTISTFIQNRQVPGPGWANYHYKFFKSSDSYIKARQFEVEATSAKSLDTTDSETNKVKRKRPVSNKKVKKVRPAKAPSSSEDDQHESDFDEQPANIGGNIFSQEEVASVTGIEFEPHLVANSSIISQELSELNTKTKPPAATINTCISPVSSRSSAKHLGPVLPLRIAQDDDADSSFLHRREVTGQGYEPFERMMVRLVTELKSDVRELLLRTANTANSDEDVEDELPVELPIGNERDIDTIEDWIIQDSNNRKQLVKFLAKFGQGSASAVTCRILREVFQPHIARGINYTGGGPNGKRCFCVLQLNRVVIDAVRRTPNVDNPTFAAIEKTIKNWFGNTRDLPGDGGRIRTVSAKKKTNPQGTSRACITPTNQD
ncbi:hypothetical protein Fcan01_25109 [Folsomia candida]|uniref:DUF4806 domain-containing protein n=1 Tax=Folsomia candida TaxID=158441 RepID=A0A226D5U8_FOLCA|nr:hypothetical protein Fcan01_25109 [Folsomia candida]